MVYVPCFRRTVELYVPKLCWFLAMNAATNIVAMNDRCLLLSLFSTLQLCFALEKYNHTS